MNTAPTRRTPMLALLPLCLAFAGGAAAGEVALHGPNGNGGDCDHPATPVPEAASPKPVPAPAVKRSTIKPVVSVRSGDSDDSTGHTPRWHSFLPGMFR